MNDNGDRQSFLGAESANIYAATVAGIVGLGGGGSHVAQQLAHIGFKNFVNIDPDIVEGSNLNRLVGATRKDAEYEVPKVQVVERQICGVQPDAKIASVQAKWQEVSGDLLQCDFIVGALDSVGAKSELEQFCRRFHIPYFDMGMDVHELPDETYLIAGQAIRSVAGEPCLRCLGVVTDKALEAEAANYGAAGGLPQVIWPNGVLASVVVGMVVHMLTPWSAEGHRHSCIEFDGNQNSLVPSPKLRALANVHCRHYPQNEAGDPLFDMRALQRGANGKHLHKNGIFEIFSNMFATLKRWLSS